MNRYADIEILKTTNNDLRTQGTRYIVNTKYPTVSLNENDIYVITEWGDRFESLAFRFYGDSTLWWFIARVNNLTTNNIPAGTSLRIPVSTKDARGF